MQYPETTTILPAECVGAAEIVDGVLDVGGVPIQLNRPGLVAGTRHQLGIYVRRSSKDLSVMEVHIAFHDGFAQEALDQENFEAERHPGGPREYWRAKSVGKDLYGPDQHLMTEADFEREWAEAEADDDEDDDFDPHALAMGDEDDRARLKEHYRAEWVGKPVAGVPGSKIQTDEDFEESWPKIEQMLANMGRSALAKSNVSDVTAPAGEYYLGDPCYAVGPHEDWIQLLETCDYFAKPVGQLPDGTQVIAFSTAYGDGLFPDNYGNEYPVDAGLIGLVPVTPAAEAALAETEQRYGRPIMTRVSFDRPMRCSRQGRGLLRFGLYRIETA
jgi:hypothetical protein